MFKKMIDLFYIVHKTVKNYPLANILIKLLFFILLLSLKI